MALFGKLHKELLILFFPEGREVIERVLLGLIIAIVGRAIFNGDFSVGTAVACFSLSGLMGVYRYLNLSYFPPDQKFVDKTNELQKQLDETKQLLAETNKQLMLFASEVRNMKSLSSMVKPTTTTTKPFNF